MYDIAIYLNHGYGLVETATADNHDDLLSVINDLMTRYRGCFCEVENTETGEVIDFNEETYWDSIYYEGEIEINI